MTEQTSKERLIAVVTLFAVTVGTVGPVGTRTVAGNAVAACFAVCAVFGAVIARHVGR